MPVAVTSSGTRHPVYPKWYTLSKCIFLFTTLLGVAWIGLIIYFLTDVTYWQRLIGPLYPNGYDDLSSFQASLISLIVFDSIMILVAVIGTILEDTRLFLLLSTYRLAVGLFYLIRWLMAGTRYGSAFFFWHKIQFILTVQMAEVVSKIKK